MFFCSQERGACRRAARGFTLVEAVVVILLTAVLAAFSLSVVEMVQQNRIISGAGEVVSALGLARGEAILRRTRVSLCPMDGEVTKGWRIVADDPECKGGGTVLFSRKEPLKAIFSCVGQGECPASAPSKFVFNPMGRLEGGAAAVVLCVAQRIEGRRIDVGRGGQAKSRSVLCSNA
ncbi:MAG: GspH/FimT family pseudopilin [Zoogloeaceae bacterium]|jgi:Tfp pilus assembly protein FimT|nr:GspH/FimT family pseudopilin [Zoogloeaceae bacterium]